MGAEGVVGRGGGGGSGGEVWSGGGSWERRGKVGAEGEGDPRRSCVSWPVIIVTVSLVSLADCQPCLPCRLSALAPCHRTQDEHTSATWTGVMS